MPPKKKAAGAAGKKGKGKGSGEDGALLTPEQLLALANANCTSLKLQLADRSLETNRMVNEKRELHHRMDEVQKEFEQEQQATFELTRDMTRQYKGMQEELLSRIAELEKTVQELRDQLDRSNQRNDKVVADKDSTINNKNKEIDQLKAQMEEMAQEFGDMLKETLDKMRERIEVNSAYNTDLDAELPIQRRMEEFSLNTQVTPSIVDSTS